MSHSIRDNVVIPWCRELEKAMTVDMVTNDAWVSELRTIINRGRKFRLFGDLTTDQVMKRLFHDARRGWCNGITECLSHDRLYQRSIVDTVQKTLQCPDRICFAQICYELSASLQYPTTDQKAFFALCDKACREGKLSAHPKMTHDMRRALQKALLFWNKHPKGKRKFAREKLALFHELMKKNGIKDQIPLSLTIDTAYKEKRAVEVARQASLLKEKILGLPLLQPIINLYICPQTPCKPCSQAFREMLRKVHSLPISEIQYSKEGHIVSVFQERNMVYRFDTESGLSQLPISDAFSLIKYIPGARYKIFTKIQMPQTCV